MDPQRPDASQAFEAPYDDPAGVFSVKNLQRRTVDGPNPSPPGMVKTLKTMG